MKKLRMRQWLQCDNMLIWNGRNNEKEIRKYECDKMKWNDVKWINEEDSIKINDGHEIKMNENENK